MASTTSPGHNTILRQVRKSTTGADTVAHRAKPVDKEVPAVVHKKNAIGETVHSRMLKQSIDRIKQRYKK